MSAPARLEHVNLTVSDADAFAAGLCDLFGWHERWRGTIDGGRALHVGSDASYIALFQFDAPLQAAPPRYSRTGQMNHMAVTVDDLEAVEAKAKAAGYPVSHPEPYEPGTRLYLIYRDEVEIEVVRYD